MQFIKGTPMIRKTPSVGGKVQFIRTENEAYINPNAIESAVYDPKEDMTAIRMTGNSGANAVLKGDVMREYEERVKGRQQGDGRDD